MPFGTLKRAMDPLSQHRTRHPRVVEALGHALESSRLHHAYILASADLAASRSLVECIGQSLVCETRRVEGGIDACGRCDPCRTYAHQNHPDVLTLAPNEKHVIPIDSVRDLSARLSLKSSTGRIKVVRIFEADRMNPAAQNALLKTLEEPSGDTCFLLTAARPRSLLLTVRSRCQKLQLGGADRDRAIRALVEGGIEEELAPLLYPLVGSDVARASALREAGAAEIIQQVDEVLARPDDQSLALRVAKDLGADRDRADLALAFIELRVRDSLAVHRGLPALDAARVPSLAPPVLADLVERLQRLRALANRSLNRTLALEALFLGLAP